MRKVSFSPLILLLFSLFFENCIISQNAVFSLAENVPIYQNPAKTGEFNGNWRIVSNYRTEGYGLSEPYISSLLTYEHKFYFYSQVFNAGLIYIHDNSASLSFPLNELGLSLAQDIRVGKRSFLKLGVQFCFDNRQFQLSNESFPEQYDRNVGYYNSLLPLSEAFISTSTSYFKVNAGVLYSLKNSFNWTFGVAGRQLNRPIESFFGQDQKLPIQWLTHSAILKNIGSNYFINPSAQYTYEQNNQILLFNLGGGFYLPKNEYHFQSINGGVLLRYGINGQVTDLGINMGVNVNNWIFTINHDFNISSEKLNLAPSSAIELSLIYIRPSTEPRVRTISNQRF